MLYASQIKNEEDDIEGYKLSSLLVNYGDETSEIDIPSEETIEWDDKVDIPWVELWKINKKKNENLEWED